jgi:hypothetical protein
MDGSQKVRDPRVLLKTHLSETSVQKTERRAEQRAVRLFFYE